jgi:NAD(P)-dependent dehydrogenase (short-subunit alcohol dehydrogenase family)
MSRTVVVTGASTGIGRATALHLANRGWRVLAGVRREEDGAALGSSVEPVILDVTDEDDIAALAQRAGELQGLVNNAGIAVNGPIELLALEEWRKQFDINVLGVVAVTRALLPALRAGGGRVVNVGSISGRTAMPFLAPYAASKFAVRAINDSLRRELRPWKMHVALIEPASVATPVWGKSDAEAERLIAGFRPEDRALYAKRIERVRAIAAREARAGAPPEDVAAKVEHALTARRPRTTYPVARGARVQIAASRLLGDRLFDAAIARLLRS